MLLLIDNFDSFVHNLARYFRRLGVETRVVRNNAVTVADVEAMRPEAIVLSPGPCSPEEAGISLDLVRRLHQNVPLLGVCLGHQTIAAALGGRVVRSPQPVHGRHSLVAHDGSDLFQGVESPFPACRYHSLIVDEGSLPAQLAPTAWTVDERTLMAIHHPGLPVYGVQFHPESVLTPSGYQLLANFLRIAGFATTEPIPDFYGERPPEPPREDPLAPPPIYY